jgi:hypothetical protein
MIIKRWNAGTTAWVEHYPKTVATQLFDTAGTTAVFDSNNKIKPAYLPDSVFDSLHFFKTTTDSSSRNLAAEAFADTLATNRSPVGYYFVATSAIDLTAGDSALATVFAIGGCSTTSGSNILTLGTANNFITVGMAIQGSNIPANTIVVSITNSTTIVMSANATLNATNTLVTFKLFFRTIMSGGEESNTYVRTFTLTSGSTSVTTGDTSNLEVGMRVSGTGIPANATIASINVNGTTFTLSANATTGGEQSLTFNPPISPSPVRLETGDWFIITKFTGLGTSVSPYFATYAIVNNTYEIMKAATSSAAGAPGLVPAPLAANFEQFLRGNGTWATPTNTTYDIATEETAGLVEIAHAKLTTAITIETASNTTNRYYGVRLNNDNQMVVNVPWVDTNTTYSKATTSALGLVETAFADLTGNPTITETNDGARYYGVQLNQAQQMVVNVPWVNTTYATATDSVLGLVKLGYAQANTQALVSLPVEGSKASSRQYGVQVDSSGNASVYVPWVNTEYTAGVGLGLSSGAFSMTQPHVVSAAEPATTFRKDNTLWFDI